MLLTQSLVGRQPHSQIKYFVKVKYFVSTLFMLFASQVACLSWAMLHFEAFSPLFLKTPFGTLSCTSSFAHDLQV